MLTGFLLAIAAGFGWGSMGVAAQVMMTDGGFTAQDLVALRVFGAGVLLTLMTLLTERGRVSKLFSDMVLLRDVVIYGLGVLATQFTFFLAIRDAGAATAAIMVITGPLFVIGWIAATTRKPVSILELAAFCLAATGVVLIITKGDLSVVNFSYSGVLWGLASAACGAFCTLQPGNAVKKLGVNAVVGFGMLFAGIGALFVYPPTEIDAVWTWETLAGYLYIIVVGTALAFVCYLKSLDYVPPAVTTILGASEPLTAVILSVVLLGTSFTPVESLGAVLIFATVFILAMREGQGLIPILSSTPLICTRSSETRRLRQNRQKQKMAGLPLWKSRHFQVRQAGHSSRPHDKKGGKRPASPVISPWPCGCGSTRPPGCRSCAS